MKKLIIFLLLTTFMLSVTLVGCSSAQIVSITVNGQTTSFYYGEEFNFDGEVIATLSNGQTRILKEEEYYARCSDYNNQVPGEYSVIVGLKEANMYYRYSIFVGSDSKTLALDNVKTQFDFAEEFSTGDIVVYKKQDDGSKITLSGEDYAIDSSEYNQFKSGTYPIRIFTDSDAITYNVTVDKMSSLNVLVFGNSYTQDSMTYFYKMAKSAGFDKLVVVNMFIGGCQINAHYSNIKSDSAAYLMELRYGDDPMKSTSNARPSDALSFADWDIIVINQASPIAGNVNTYSRLQETVDIIKDKLNALGQDASRISFAFQQCWAYAEGSSNSNYVNYNNSQEKMYNAIMGAVKEGVLTTDCKRVMPIGTALQNARNTSLGDNFSRDSGDHLNVLGKYIASLTVLSSLTDISIDAVTFKPETVNNEVEALCKLCVTNAINNPYEVTKNS